MNEKEGVSVVICCYNSSSRITPTLEHLQRISTRIPWEVVLVDNNSDDDTRAKAMEIWSRNPVVPLKIVEEKKRGHTFARHRGVASSIYDVISFIDDDNWIDDNWIDKTFFIMHNDPRIGVCGGIIEPVFEKDPPEWFNYISHAYAVGKQQTSTGFVKPEKGYLWGAGLTVSRAALADLYNSGFQSLLQGRTGKVLSAGDDSEFCLALTLRGWKIWYDESLKLKHFIPKSRLEWDYLIKMSRGFGKAEVVLSLYRGFIDKNTGNKPTWTRQSIVSIMKLIVSGLRRLFPFGKNKIYETLMWIHYKAYTSELIFHKKKYAESKKRISQFAKVAPVKFNQEN